MRNRTVRIHGFRFLVVLAGWRVEEGKGAHAVVAERQDRPLTTPGRGGCLLANCKKIATGAANFFAYYVKCHFNSQCLHIGPSGSVFGPERAILESELKRYSLLFGLLLSSLTKVAKETKSTANVIQLMRLQK